MASINERELLRIIRSGELSGAYYLYGADLFAAVKCKREMVKSCVKKGDETYNLHEFDGGQLDVRELCEVCESLPVFAPKLCVTVCDLDLDSKKLSDAQTKLLFQTVSELPDTAVLIFYTANIDICGKKKYPTPKNKKLADLVAKTGTVCEFAIKSKSEAVKSIRSYASENGKGIDSRAAELLWERVSGDMNAAVNELDKLISYAAEREISAEDVSLLTPETSDAKAYNLADAVASGNKSRAAGLLQELLFNRSDPVYLLYVLTGGMNDLYRARLAIDSNRSVSDAVKDFSYPKNMEFKVKNAFSAAGRTSAARLGRCMELLARADIEMKSGAGDPAVILEKTVMQMLSGE